MGNRLGSSDGNGAGIRPEVNYSSKGPNGFPLPYNLTVTNSGFIGNGNGILADDCSDTRGFDASYGPQPGPNPIGSTGSQSRTASFRMRSAATTLRAARSIPMSRTTASSMDRSAIPTTTLISRWAAMRSSRTICWKRVRSPRGTFISWNEENYLPTLYNPGTSMVIDGNTFIENWTAANSYYQAYILQDASQWQTHKRATTTNGPVGTTVQLTNDKIDEDGGLGDRLPPGMSVESTIHADDRATRGRSE